VTSVKGRFLERCDGNLFHDNYAWRCGPARNRLRYYAPPSTVKECGRSDREIHIIRITTIPVDVQTVPAPRNRGGRRTIRVGARTPASSRPAAAPAAIVSACFMSASRQTRGNPEQERRLNQYDSTLRIHCIEHR
jgi:hypothetical protein